jgi:hypothetical protein
MSKKGLSAGLRARTAISHDENIDGVDVETGPQWSVGEIPVTWKPSELKQLHKNCLRDNYKRGVINKETYRRMLNEYQSPAVA